MCLEVRLYVHLIFFSFFVIIKRLPIAVVGATTISIFFSLKHGYRKLKKKKKKKKKKKNINPVAKFLKCGYRLTIYSRILKMQLICTLESRFKITTKICPIATFNKCG